MMGTVQGPQRLGSRRYRGAPSLVTEALGIPERGHEGEVVLFFSLLHEAKITGPGEGQLQAPPLAKSNYKFYP